MLINYLVKFLNYIKNLNFIKIILNNYSSFNIFLFFFNLTLFFFLSNFFFKIFYIILILFFGFCGYLKNIFFFIKDIFFIFFNLYDNNLKYFKTDIDASVNTDGEDLIVYVNDLIEISLSERSLFFDIILANPFEFGLIIFTTFFLNLLFFKGKIKSPISLFKFFKKLK